MWTYNYFIKEKLMKILLPIFLVTISLSTYAKSEKVTCYKYNARKGKFRESSKKKCNGRSWHESEEAAVKYTKEKCDKKVKKGRASWDEGRKLCVSKRRSKRNNKKCERANKSLEKYKDIDFSYKVGNQTVSSTERLKCDDVSKSELKLVSKITGCLRRISKFNKKSKKKNGKQVAFSEVFSDGKCDKKKIRRTKAVSNKRCERVFKKLKDRTKNNFGLTAEFCKEPTKNDLRMLKQLAKCDRKTGRGKNFVYDSKRNKCINMKRNVDMAKVKNLRKANNLTAAKAQKCLKLTKRMKRRSKGSQYVRKKDLLKLKKKGCLTYD